MESRRRGKKGGFPFVTSGYVAGALIATAAVAGLVRLSRKKVYSPKRRFGSNGFTFLDKK